MMRLKLSFSTDGAIPMHRFAFFLALALFALPKHEQPHAGQPLSYVVLDGHMYNMASYGVSSYSWLQNETFALDLPEAWISNCTSHTFDQGWNTIAFYGYVAPPVMVESINYRGYEDADGVFYAWTINTRYGDIVCEGEVPLRAGYQTGGNDVIFSDGFDAEAVPAGDVVFASSFD